MNFYIVLFELMVDSDDSLFVGMSCVKGFIKNVNIIEDFNNVNKIVMIEDIGW